MEDLRIAFAGPSGSGKTSLFHLLSGKKQKIKPTIGPSVCTRQFQSGTKVKELKIIDTSGNNQLKDVTRTFLKGINGGILVFDLSNKESFEKIDEWFHELKRSQDIIIILVGNKKDQIRQINDETIKAYASHKNINYFETDFKDKAQIEKILNALLKEIYTYEVNSLKKDIMSDSRVITRLGNGLS